jgi:hypothetical protein
MVYTGIYLVYTIANFRQLAHIPSGYKYPPETWSHLTVGVQPILDYFQQAQFPMPQVKAALAARAPLTIRH